MLASLQSAGRREIGGVLMGEHIGAEEFRIADLTVQRRSGALAYFVRLVTEAAAKLRAFFDRTQHDYTRYNYLGEWHSHPGFALSPSGKDMDTMLDIVTDPDVGANFAVLMIVRLSTEGALEARATAFLPDQKSLLCEVHMETEHEVQA